MASNDDNNNVIPSSQPTDKRVPTGKGKKASGRGKTPAAENPSAEDETGGITRRLCEVDQVIDRRSDENMVIEDGWHGICWIYADWLTCHHLIDFLFAD